MHTEHIPLTPESQAWSAKDATWGLQPHLKPNHKQDFKTLFSAGLIVPAAPKLPPVVEWFWVCW